MRVLYLSDSAQIGGGNRVLLELWAGVRDHGITPLSVCPADGPMVGECGKIGVPCEVVDYIQPSWRQPLATWASYRSWSRIIRKNRVDLIHANELNPGRTIVLAAKRWRVPLICHVHFPLGDQFSSWCFRHLPKPQGFFFCSRSLQEESGPELALAAPRAWQTVIHNGISLDVFRDRGREQNGRQRVGIVANLIPIKGHLDFLEMAHRVTTRGIDAEYWIIGEDIHGTGYRAELERRSCELGLNERVRFLGQCMNVPDLLPQLDVAVCSSHAESFGLCVIEAMACGRAVVGTRVGGIREIIEDGISGLLVPPKDPEHLAEAVERLLRNQEMRHSLGRNGRARVESHFSQAAHVTKTVSGYRTVLDFGKSVSLSESAQHKWCDYCTRMIELYDSLV